VARPVDETLLLLQQHDVTESRLRRPGYYTIVLLLTAAVFISYIDRTNISVGAIAMQTQFGWNETQKGLVLSSFFIGYLPLMVASGALANRYGGKTVLGLAVIWWSLFTALTPPAALISLPALVCARVALGLGEAAVYPASFNMIGRWVPALHRSRAVALMTSGAALGTVFALPVSGWLVRDYGWPLPFYAFGAAGLVWAGIWFTRLRGGYGAELRRSSARAPIPWHALMHSPAVWAIIVGHFCYNWCSYVLLAWLPSYFKSTFGVNVADAGLFSAAPWLVGFLMANLAGYLADHLLRVGCSATLVRKLAQTIGLTGAGIFLLLLPGATSITWAVILMCIAAGLLALCLAGFPPNCLDIAPHHADVLYGISNTIATLPGLFGVFITGWLVDQTGSFAVALLVTAGVAILGAVVFLSFASGQRQFG
jgi:MFS transporter, ACS family, solute carrier family 17 (sodium-dependent inorganic phosphate cotransporter), other